MRLWHYSLIKYLPDSQLLAQWRELNSIYRKRDKHILINYIYDYPISELYVYSIKVIKEMLNRKFKVRAIENFKNFFGIDIDEEKISDSYSEGEVFVHHHDLRYLLQCFYNLQEKFDRGQKDFTENKYLELYEYMSMRGLA